MKLGCTLLVVFFLNIFFQFQYEGKNLLMDLFLIFFDRQVNFHQLIFQVLQERGESTSRHGRAAFSVLLFQVILKFQHI